MAEIVHVSVDVATGEVTALPDPEAIEQTDPMAADDGHDPYNRTEPARPADDTVKVRTLDDMRRLSNEIKQDRKPYSSRRLCSLPLLL